ncbi:MAG: DUF2384 domain-containing protein [Alphaproteobacteria bacterium]|nr:DUF2384 domain-containing protein [Alphaproteobacteria bacterium]
MVDLAGDTAHRRAALSGPGLRAFLAIAEQWRLSEADRLCVLGRPSRSAFHNWAAKVRQGEAISLSQDTLLRISAILGIHKGLTILFNRQFKGVEWLRSPNKAVVFGGQAPMDLVLSGSQDGLMLVRRYLDSWRGGLFASPVPGLDGATQPYADGDIVFLP